MTIKRSWLALRFERNAKRLADGRADFLWHTPSLHVMRLAAVDIPIYCALAYLIVGAVLLKRGVSLPSPIYGLVGATIWVFVGAIGIPLGIRCVALWYRQTLGPRHDYLCERNAESRDEHILSALATIYSVKPGCIKSSDSATSVSLLSIWSKPTLSELIESLEASHALWHVRQLECMRSRWESCGGVNELIEKVNAQKCDSAPEETI